MDDIRLLDVACAEHTVIRARDEARVIVFIEAIGKQEMKVQRRSATPKLSEFKRPLPMPAENGISRAPRGIELPTQPRN